MLRVDPRSQAPGPRGNAETTAPYANDSVGPDVGYQEPTLTFDNPEDNKPSQPTRRPSRPSVDASIFSSHHQHRRQHTAPSLSPLRISQRAHSPPRGHIRQSSDMAYTGDGRKGSRRESGIAGSVRGSSTPPPEETHSPDTTPKSRQGLTPMATTPKNVTSTATTQSRFGFLSSLTNRLSGQPSPAQQAQIEDELLNMNVEAALYPAGSPTDGEAFSPAAYKNLQANATGLLLKMQSGYRQRTIALHEMQAERSAEKEEAEESKMRVENLKVQLEHMANQAQDQETALKQLMSELQAEREARKEERFLRMAHEKILAERSISSEDLEVDEDEQRGKWRKSAGTLKSEVSFGDTDEESAENESVFSRSRSPTILTSATESVAGGDASTLPSPQQQQQLQAKRASNNLELPPKPKFGKEMSTFQKLMKGISGDGGSKDGAENADGCKTCRGQEPSMAWDTVSLLRDENKGLKHRVAQLEVAVEGALDMVNGIGVRS
ncbi:hypothetical protein PGQ11_003259 [Apiospora arundinis]|uniref:Cep57 centrosome microtubule-binding domain-containing protein n=1 Tax=Apiospora arundinis TaxID=335852 RepID=A0ABR2J538_9PEZI